MRKEIEALLARENERFERVSAEQRHMKAQLEGVQIKNHELLLKKTYHEDRIRFLNEMLEDEVQNEKN